MVAERGSKRLTPSERSLEAATPRETRVPHAVLGATLAFLCWGVFVACPPLCPSPLQPLNSDWHLSDSYPHPSFGRNITLLSALQSPRPTGKVLLLQKHGSWLTGGASLHLGSPPPSPPFSEMFSLGPTFPSHFSLRFCRFRPVPALSALGLYPGPPPAWPSVAPGQLVLLWISTWWSRWVAGVPGIRGTWFWSQPCCHHLAA